MNGICYLFPLHSWVFLDAKDPPRITELVHEYTKIRVYPPFASRSPEALVDRVESDKVPFRPNRDPSAGFRVMPAPLALPQFSSAVGAPASIKLFGLGPDGRMSPGPTPEEMPSDFIRMDVYAESEDDGLRHSVVLLERLNELIRWRTRQWWVTRSSDGLSGATLTSFPVTEAGSISARSRNLSAGVRSYTMNGDEKPLSNGDWQQVLRDIDEGTYPPIGHVLLFDARYFHSIGDLRQAVIQADAACEIVKEQTFETLWTQRNPGKLYDPERRNDLLRNWDLPRHIDAKFANHFGRSYRQEHPAQWTIIDQLWQARNNVAHGAENTFGDPPESVTPTHVRDFLAAADHCISWLESLP